MQESSQERAFPDARIGERAIRAPDRRTVSLRLVLEIGIGYNVTRLRASGCARHWKWRKDADRPGWIIDDVISDLRAGQVCRFRGACTAGQTVRGCPEPLLGSALGMEGPEAVSRFVHRAQTTSAYLDLARPSPFNNGSLLYVDLELALGVPH